MSSPPYPEPTPGSARYVGRIAILGLEFASHGNLLAAEVLIGEHLITTRAQAFAEAIASVRSWGEKRRAEAIANRSVDQEQSEYDEHAAGCAASLADEIARAAKASR